MDAKHDTEFLNVDLDIDSKFDLFPLAEFFGNRTLVLYCGPLYNGLQRLSIEGNSRRQLKHTPDRYSRYLIDLIHTLPPNLFRLWNRASSRTFDYGFRGGIVPPPYPIKAGREIMPLRSILSPRTTLNLSQLRATIQITVYPYEPW
jgi:hypothetical protein